MKKSLIVSGGLALGCLLPIPVASALTLDLDPGKSLLANISTSSDGGSSWHNHGVGAFGGTLDGKPFVSYSVELDQPLSWNPKDYTLTRFSMADQNMLDRLYTVADGKVTDQIKGIAFQLAVWEITHEDTDDFQVKYGALGAGLFAASNLLVAHSSAYTTAQQWLDEAKALNANHIRWHTQRLGHANYQDYVLASQVPAIPEPASYAMLLAGGGLVGWLARRQQRQAIRKR